MTGGRRGGLGANPWVVALVAIAVLAAAQFALPSYHHTNVARIMVFAVFAVGSGYLFYRVAYTVPRGAGRWSPILLADGLIRTLRGRQLKREHPE